MLFRTYSRTARKRGLSWTLGFEEYCSLALQDCVYCGRKPINRVTHEHFRTRFHYQGLDRKNNRLGYTKANAVPCCSRCNSVKGQHLDYRTMVMVGKLFKSLKQ